MKPLENNDRGNMEVYTDVVWWLDKSVDDGKQKLRGTEIK